MINTPEIYNNVIYNVLHFSTFFISVCIISLYYEETMNFSVLFGSNYSIYWKSNCIYRCVYSALQSSILYLVVLIKEKLMFFIYVATK